MTKPNSKFSDHSITRTLAAVGAASLFLVGSRVLLNYFGPSRPFGLDCDPDADLCSDEFLNFLSQVTNGAVRRSKITRLRDGAEFYPAQLEAIRGAKYSINLETYEFLEGRISDQFLAALAERARAGVEVRLVVDAVGSMGTRDAYFKTLRDAGGKMFWYHPLRWNTWQLADNRTHRKLLIVDAAVGFIGGAGIADQWITPSPGKPVWRDTMFRVEGEAVAGLVSTFSENWLESSGEILCGPKQFRADLSAEGSRSFVVLSTPKGGGTQAHILFQALIQSARKTIRITTPYFLPDRSARSALVQAIRERGVKVQILTAGPKIDHTFIRGLSRNSSRRLLQAGAEILEYQPSMIHAKLMTVDEQWCVVGSTNFDHRSFELNDEVNLAALDPALAKVIEDDFERDVRLSRPLTLAMLHRPSIVAPIERVIDHAMEQES